MTPRSESESESPFVPPKGFETELSVPLLGSFAFSMLHMSENGGGGSRNSSPVMGKGKKKKKKT